MDYSESTEHYLKTILKLQMRLNCVHAVDIAREMNVTKASVSRALKKFKANGDITVAQDGGIVLNPCGYAAASKVSETYRDLVAVLERIGVSDGTAQEDACRMEHALSEETHRRLKEYFSDAL